MHRRPEHASHCGQLSYSCTTAANLLDPEFELLSIDMVIKCAEEYAAGSPHMCITPVCSLCVPVGTACIHMCYGCFPAWLSSSQAAAALRHVVRGGNGDALRSNVIPVGFNNRLTLCYIPVGAGQHLRAGVIAVRELIGGLADRRNASKDFAVEALCKFSLLPNARTGSLWPELRDPVTNQGTYPSI